jgi:large subunit ribosomal protein L29
MKAEALREMSEAELEAQLHDLTSQIWKLRFQASTGQAEGVRKLRAHRKDIARALTILRERELRKSHGQ